MLVNSPLIASSASSRAATTTTSSINSRYVLACEWILVLRLAGDWEFRRRKWRRISLRLSYRVSKPLKVKEEEEGGGDSFFFLRWMRARRGYSKHCFLRASRQSRAFHRVRSLFRKFSFECLERRFRVFYFFVPRAWKGYRWRFSLILSPFVYIVILDACIYME